MAGHPLRPATRRSLGEPLPHQQADRPRAHPSPKRLSTRISCESASYPVLATVSGGYPEVKGRLLTCYSPVRRSCTPEGALPLDLHVLSTPPAFVLSQDQTLRRKTKPPRVRRLDDGRRDASWRDQITDKNCQNHCLTKEICFDSSHKGLCRHRALQTNSSTMTHC